MQRHRDSMVSKGEGSSPNKLRPISLMSVVYRLWAAARVRDMMQWQQTWIGKDLHAYRKNHGAEDVWYSLALKIERALLLDEDLIGFSLDFSKCFDRVPASIVFDIAKRQGMPEKVRRSEDPLALRPGAQQALVGPRPSDERTSSSTERLPPLSQRNLPRRPISATSQKASSRA